MAGAVSTHTYPPHLLFCILLQTLKEARRTLDQTLFGVVAGMIAAVIALLRITGRIGTSVGLADAKAVVDDYKRRTGMR